ncbi:MAG: hypothetical protein GY847_06795 [Proteobacteria bacterium]|nr:hypothetical protein [Pseudomonadota bacterium]
MFFAPSVSSARVDLTSEEIEKISQGRLVIRPMKGSRKNSVIAGSSFALINARPDIVSRAFEDLSAWPSIFYNTNAARLVAIRGNKKTVKMSLGNKYITVDFFLNLVSYNDSMEFAYSIDRSRPNDIEDTRGWLKLIPQPEGRTLVVFSTYAKVPFGMLIALMGDKVLYWIETRLLSVPKGLKKWVEGPTGAKYR